MLVLLGRIGSRRRDRHGGRGHPRLLWCEGVWGRGYVGEPAVSPVGASLRRATIMRGRPGTRRPSGSSASAEHGVHEVAGGGGRRRCPSRSGGADAGGERARDRPLERAAGGPLAEPFGEHQRGREQHPARVRDALSGDVGCRAVRRSEDAGAVLGQPAARRRSASRFGWPRQVRDISSACCLLGHDDAEAARARSSAAGSASLSDSRSTSTPGWRSASQATNAFQAVPSPDGGDLGSARAGQVERAADDERLDLVVERADDAMSPPASRTR